MPVKPCFNNPSVGQTSKSSSDTQKKPWLNKNDIVHLKTNARKDLEIETRLKQCSRFLVKSESASNSQPNY